MDKSKAIEELKAFLERLHGEVCNAYGSRGSSFGDERFASWRRKFTSFLSENIPSQVAILNDKLIHHSFSLGMTESDLETFWRIDGANMEAFIESLILDINNDEFDFSLQPEEAENAKETKELDRTKVFIVHGHDGEAKQKVARFVEKLGFEAIILHEQANGGKTIIEKIEHYAEVGFGIVLYTPDDSGNVTSESEKGVLKPRARQNVVFEHGFLVGRIGRQNVAAIVSGDVELPNDISGLVYITDSEWQVDVAKEMKAAGYKIDFNTIL